MSGYHNDVIMQQAHRQDLLNEAHLDRLAHEANGGRTNRIGELAAHAIRRVSCLLINWGKGISAGSQGGIHPIGTAVASWGLGLNGLLAAGTAPCECCV
jgi:hypothetical protein